MKIQFTVILIVCLFSLGLNGQTLVKTFYDFQKTRVNEVFYVNSKGEKNGVYKTYNKNNGVLEEEATFINGELNGVHKLYDVSSGRSYLRQSETYKNNRKNGEAKYFSGDNYTITHAQGNYLDGKREGLWTIIEVIEGETRMEYSHYKFNRVFKDDEIISEDQKYYYYPSGKLYAENTLKNNKLIEEKIYHPNGMLGSNSFYDENQKLITEKQYYENGQLAIERLNKLENGKEVREYKSWYQNKQLKEEYTTLNNNEVSYKGYNQDGSKNEKMLSQERSLNEQEDRRRKEEEQKIKLRDKLIFLYTKEFKLGDSLYKLNYYDDAMVKYTKANTLYVSSKDSVFKRLFKDRNDEVNLSIYEIEVRLKQNKVIYEKYDLFLSLYAKDSKEIRSTIGHDNPNPPINHSDGKYVFEKGNTLYEEKIASAKVEKNVSKAIELYNDVIWTLDKLISLASTDTKDLDKKLKKATSKEEVMTLLGL